MANSDTDLSPLTQIAAKYGLLDGDQIVPMTASELALIKGGMFVRADYLAACKKAFSNAEQVRQCTINLHNQ